MWYACRETLLGDAVKPLMKHDAAFTIMVYVGGKVLCSDMDLLQNGTNCTTLA